MSGAATVVVEVIPIALAVAASPFAIIPAVLLLLGPRPRPTAVGFLGGWALGVLFLAAVATLLAEVLDRPGEPPGWAAWVRVVLGAGLLLLAGRGWVTRHASTDQPAWLRSLSEATPASALRTGLLLSAANPKVVLLVVAAGVAIGSADLTTTGDIVAVIAFVALACLSVAAPLVLHLVAGPRALAPLERARDWLERNHAAVVSVVLALIGLALLAEGMAAL